MNITTAAIIVNQLYANAKLSNIDNEIGSLNNNLQRAEDERQRQQVLRQLIFSLREALEDIQDQANSAFLYYTVGRLMLDIQLKGVTVQSFHELSDKEYTRGMFLLAKELQAKAAQNLDAPTIHNLDYTVKNDRAIPLYANLYRWTRIRELLQKDSQGCAVLIMVGSLIPNLVIWVSSPPPYSNDAEKAGGVILTVLFSSMLIFSSFLVIRRYLKFKRVFPECKRLAEEGGGWVTKEITKARAQEIVAGLEQELRNLGFNTFSTSEEYADALNCRRNEFQQVIDQTNLPLRLS